MSETSTNSGMSERTAKIIERSILALCGFSLIAIFQPISQILFGIGAGLVVLAGLAFNLVPLCQPNRSLWKLMKGALIVLVVFLLVTALAVGSAELYGIYLKSR